MVYGKRVIELPEKFDFSDNPEDVNRIMDSVLDLSKDEIRTYINSEIDFTSRLRKIRKDIDGQPTSLRYDEFDSFKDDLGLSLLQKQAKAEINFPTKLIKKQITLNELRRQQNEQLINILNIKLLVLLKSCSSFVTFASEDEKKEFTKTLVSILSEKLDEAIDEMTPEEEVDNIEDEENQENGQPIEDDASSESEGDVELTESMEITVEGDSLTFLSKICHLLEEEPPDVINRLIQEEVEKLRERIEFWLNDKEKQLLYQNDIRTLSQLEAVDLDSLVLKEVLSPEDAAEILEIRKRFTQNE